VTQKRTTTRASAREEKERLARENEALKLELSRLQSIKGEQGGLEETRIPLDELIPVMSLLPYTLNLSTLGNGRGKEIKFTQYGQVKQVLYQDVLGILEYHYSFAEYGYFIILNEKVVRKHGLQDVYSKILTKDKIDQILSGSKSSVELYSISNPEQQKTIVGMLIEKLRDDVDSVDLNVVDKISRLSGVNIAQKAEEARDLMRKDTAEE
jgi:hypothetical protein